MSMNRTIQSHKTIKTVYK